MHVRKGPFQLFYGFVSQVVFTGGFTVHRPKCSLLSALFAKGQPEGTPPVSDDQFDKVEDGGERMKPAGLDVLSLEKSHKH